MNVQFVVVLLESRCEKTRLVIFMIGHYQSRRLERGGGKAFHAVFGGRCSCIESNFSKQCI